ncbi:MAG: endonuclease [Methanomassiliicoccales archaeon]|nr:MAG: endonuclease [Methanomassiliicoccales archaeon]
MDIDEMRKKMSALYDVKDWWPSESPFEVIVGAILTQQTTWETVTKVLDSMRRKGLLDLRTLATSDGELESTVRPTGFYNQKANRLRSIARYLIENHDGDVRSFLDRDLAILRKDLLSIKGIGEETADTIILFAAGKPSFVAASYVARVLTRTGALEQTSYGEVKRFVESRLPCTVQDYREFYALCVQHCKTVCLSRPRCEACALSGGCPSSSK